MRYIKNNLKYITNTKFMKSLLYTLLFLFSLSFQSYSQIVIDQIIAVIGDEMIKQSDVENQVFQMKQLNSKQQISECKIFEELLIQKILVDQAKIDSLQVTDAEIDAEISRRIALFVGDAGDMSKLESFYGKTELEIKTEWRPLIKEQLLAQQVQNSIIGKIEVSPNEIKKFYNSENKDSLPLIPIQYEYAQIIIKPKISEAEEAEIKRKLEEIRQRAIKGESFSKLAVLYSDDTESAKVGGLLGDYMSRGELVPEFAAAAFKLKDGEISRIVKTDFGYHIIQMVEMKGEKAKLKHILIRPKVSTLTLQKTSDKADSVYKLLQDTLSFEKAALLYSSDMKTKFNGGKYLNPYTNSPKFEVDMIEPSILYSLKKLKPGQISEPILSFDETGSQVYKIIKLISVTPEHKADLINDYQVIKDMTIANKKDLMLNSWLTNKQERTYINIPDSRFKTCSFKYKGWVK